MNIRHIILLSAVLFFSCEGKKQGYKETEEKAQKAESVLAMPERTSFTVGEIITIEAVNASPDVSIDSVQFFVNNRYVGAVHAQPFKFSLNSTPLPVGPASIRATTFFNNGARDTDHKSIVLLSDIAPDHYGYRIVRRYRHDPRAFTQGLSYHEGYLYEGTGQKGESSIRKSDLLTGETLKIKYLPSQYFGEGIAIHNGKLYQLTWRSRKGFVYDLDSFELIREFSYPREGWGLTNIGDTLFMSDGSSTLYKLSAATLTEIGRLHVYDQTGPVADLNELEFINGLIYANVYQTDEIVMIDPNSGKITGRIDLSGLIDQNPAGQEIDVLNGIAYDAAKNRLFVTGKYWAYIFEIDLIKREPAALRAGR